MFYRKIFILSIFTTSSLLISSCATSYAPSNWLPDTDQVQEETFGGWITLVTKPDSLNQNEKWMQYSGEFIAVDENVVYLLYNSVYQIPIHKIYSSILELDSKDNTGYAVWTFGGTLSTISNGYFLVITAPLWLLVGISSTVGESSRDRYEIEYPKDVYWEKVKKFSRFPQGVSDIDLANLKPKVIPEE